MKKYLLKLTALVLFVGTIVGCSEDKVFYEESKGPTAGYFTETSGTMGVSETRNTKKVPVQVSTLSSVDRAVTFTLDADGSSENIEEFIELVPEQSLIPAGSYDGYVTVRFKKSYEDIEFDNDLTAFLVLSTIQGGKVDNSQKFHVLTVFKDCDFAPATVGTAYLAEATANKYQSFDGYIVNYEQVLEKTSDPNVFHVNTLWGEEFIYNFSGNASHIGAFNAPGKIIVNPADNTLTIQADPINGQASYITGGTGTLDGCNNVFTYTITQRLVTGLPFTTTVVLTPAPAPAP